METVLLGSEHELDQKLRGRQDLLARNYIGQSALHLAIRRPKLLRKLIPHYDMLDIPDRGGTTPLMYAAAYNETESVLSLINDGLKLKLFQRDELRNRDFLHYAMVRGNWNLIYSVINHIKPHLEEGLAQRILTCILQRHLVNFDDLSEEYHFKKLLHLGASPNATFAEGATLLHLAPRSGHVKALFEAGFKLINHKDDSGVTPLMKVIRLQDTALGQRCLDEGASIESSDGKGWTALHYAAAAFHDLPTASRCESSEDFWILRRFSELVNVVKLLLSYGANPATVDRCPCACSGSGCTAAIVFLRKSVSPSFSSPWKVVWSLEWLQMLLELAPEKSGEQFLLELVRMIRFKDFELTHVCCRDFSETLAFAAVDENDIDEILDEENELVDDLEKSMEMNAKNLRGGAEENCVTQISTFARKFRDQELEVSRKRKQNVSV